MRILKATAKRFRLHIVRARSRQRVKKIKRTILGYNKPGIVLPPRAPSTPTRYLSVAIIAKNEAPYMAEWLEFQRMMEVEHVYVYDNRSADDLSAVLAPFVRQGYVTLIPWHWTAPIKGENVQHLAYAHSICSFGDDWRWMAFLDADEFLFPLGPSHDSLASLLNDYEALPAITVPWTNFGHSGHKKKPSGLVIESYTMRAPPLVNAYKKVIVNPSEVEAMFTHRVRLRNNQVAHDENGSPYQRGDPTPQSRIFRLNHYFVKSLEEFEKKVALRMNCTHKVSRDIAGEEKRRTAAAIEEKTFPDTAILRYVPKLKHRLAAVRA